MRPFIPAVLVAALASCQSTKKEPVAQDGLVPKPFTVDVAFKVYDAMPPVRDMREILGAIDYVLTLEGSPRFNQPRDKKVFRWLRDIREDRRKIEIEYLPVATGRPDGKVGTIRMAYRCGDGTLIVSALQTTMPFLAKTIFHEFSHAVSCEEDFEREGAVNETEREAVIAKKDGCKEEEQAYAAEIRFFLALHDRNLLPNVVVMDQLGDIQSYLVVGDMWEAIYEKRFCAWYEERGKGIKPRLELHIRNAWK